MVCTNNGYHRLCVDNAVNWYNVFGDCTRRAPNCCFSCAEQVDEEVVSVRNIAYHLLRVYDGWCMQLDRLFNGERGRLGLALVQLFIIAEGPDSDYQRGL